MNACKNTDREIYRRIPGDFYSPSMHVTLSDGIGINHGGHVIVAPLEIWHAAGERMFCDCGIPKWRVRLAKWLLRWGQSLDPKRFLEGQP